jgi:hypothetical protein
VPKHSCGQFTTAHHCYKALQVNWRKKHPQICTKYCLPGLLLVSPGVGMEVNNYVERVLPGNAETLRAGLAVEHPTIDQHVRISIDLASLEDYEQVDDPGIYLSIDIIRCQKSLKIDPQVFLGFVGMARQIKLDNLLTISPLKHCILRRPMPAFDFPVRIVHGIYDKVGRNLTFDLNSLFFSWFPSSTAWNS